MAVRQPLYYNSGNLQEMTTTQVNEIVDQIVYQYSLSTAWDISTASYDSISFSVSSESTQPVSVRFKSDGSKMYVLDVSNNSVFQYST